MDTDADSIYTAASGLREWADDNHDSTPEILEDIITLLNKLADEKLAARLDEWETEVANEILNSFDDVHALATGPKRKILRFVTSVLIGHLVE